MKKIILFIFAICLIVGCKNVFENPDQIDNTPPANPEVVKAIPNAKKNIISWINPTDSDFAQVKIFRRTDDQKVAIAYETPIYSGVETKHGDLELDPQIKYYYTVYACDHNGNYSSGVKVTAKPVDEDDITAPAEITSLVRTYNANKIIISWNNPSDVDLAGVKIVRNNDQEPVSHSDGTTISSSLNNTVEDANIVKEKKYYYKIYTYDYDQNYSNGVSIDAVYTSGSDKTPPGEVKSLKALAGSGPDKITITWEIPNDTDLEAVKIIRKESGYPANHLDGVQVYNGKEEAVIDLDVDISKKYYYRVFTYDIYLNYSSGVNALVAYDTPCDIPGVNISCCD